MRVLSVCHARVFAATYLMYSENWARGPERNQLMARDLRRNSVALMAVCLMALGLLSAQSAQATQIWLFTGAPFDSQAQAPFSASDFVVAQVTLANPAPTNGTINLNTTTVVSYQLGVGSGFILDETNSTMNTSNSFTFTNGQLTAWTVNVLTNPRNPINIQQYDPHSYKLASNPNALRRVFLYARTGSDNLDTFGTSSGVGSWVVPEPSIASLVAVMFVGLAARRVRG